MLQVICKGWKWWDKRVVDDVGRREAVSTTRLRSGLYINLAVGRQVATGACGHQQHFIMVVNVYAAGGKGSEDKGRVASMKGWPVVRTMDICSKWSNCLYYLSLGPVYIFYMITLSRSEVSSGFCNTLGVIPYRNSTLFRIADLSVP
jgi:hypothetical protein